MAIAREEFERQLTDPTVAFVRDYSDHSDTMLIAFGGINQGMGMPPFEFFQMASSFPVKRLFFRDVKQAWYHCGLNGAGDDISAIARFIASEIEQQKPRHTVAVGNSMGGFAAILFGALTGVSHVLAFSPQTFIAPLTLLRHRDFRWPRRIWRAYWSREKRPCHDLKRVLQTHSIRACDIHFSERSPLDSIHARHLAACGNVTLHSYPEGGHRLIQHLKRSGQLSPLVSTALGSTGAGAPPV